MSFRNEVEVMASLEKKSRFSTANLIDGGTSQKRSCSVTAPDRAIIVQSNAR
jgi:hypothetical protein